MANRWLFSCCNGLGLGHLSRMIGLARQIRKRRPGDHFLFLTNSEVPHLIWREDFASVKMPSFEFYKKNEDRSLTSEIADEVIQSIPDTVLASFRPDVVVVDTFPVGQRFELAPLANYAGKKVLLHREVGERRWNPNYEAAIKNYNLILLPFLKDDLPLTLPPGTKARWVGPIMPRSRDDQLPKEEARARLGLGSGGKVCYVCFGGGGDPAYEKLVNWVLGMADKFPDWTFAVPQPPLLIEPLKKVHGDNISYFQYFPVCECFAAFDAAISFTGDTVFELAHFGVPPIIVPKTVLTGEDHLHKARSVVSDGRGFIVPEYDTDALVEAMNKMGDEQRRREISRLLIEKYGNIDGSTNAANTLVDWVEHSGEDRSGGQEAGTHRIKRKEKIFGIGLSRTGTTSLTEALKILGSSAIHFPTRYDEIDRHDASTDTPIALNFRDLDQRYPESKFILTIRDHDEWLESCERFWNTNGQNFETNPFIKNLHNNLYGGNDFDRERFSEVFERHIRTVKEYFENRRDDLLILDLFELENPWISLCEFLGREIPKQSFPHQNQSTTVDEIILRLLAATGAEKETAEIAEVSPAYIHALIKEGRKPDFSRKLTLDGGQEGELIVHRIIQRKGIDQTAQVLGMPIENIRELANG